MIIVMEHHMRDKSFGNEYVEVEVEAAQTLVLPTIDIWQEEDIEEMAAINERQTATKRRMDGTMFTL